MNYMNTFATHTLGIPPAQAFGATVAVGAATCGAIINLLGGWLSDRIGRKPVMIGVDLAVALLGLPCFPGDGAFANACSALYGGASA